MGRSPCCSKEGLNRGAWTAQEDKILLTYVNVHGPGKWRNLPQRAGLKRCGKSCRLRWLNYLRPDIKRGNISPDEEELIIRLHKLLGNKWSLIAGRLPGRTDNEIKNYWNTNLGKKVKDGNSNTSSGNTNEKYHRKTKPQSTSKVAAPSSLDMSKLDSNVIRTKASKCSKVLFLDPHPHSSTQQQNNFAAEEAEPCFVEATANNLTSNKMETSVFDDGLGSFPSDEKEHSTDLLLDFDIGELCFPDLLNFNVSEVCNLNSNNDQDLLPFSDQPLVSLPEILKNRTQKFVTDEENDNEC